MKTFSNPIFLLSAEEESQFPKTHLKEVAIAGRSNVGKSSLINHLFNKKNLAKTSSTTGKTRQINFFNIDDRFLLIDPPGYGYAKVNKSTKKHWSILLTDYFTNRSSLSLILFLLDIRRIPSKEDIAFYRWCIFHKKPLTLVFTKTDKLKKSQLIKQIPLILDTLGIDKNDSSVYNTYSIYDNRSKEHLTKLILDNLKGEHGPDQ